MTNVLSFPQKDEPEPQPRGELVPRGPRAWLERQPAAPSPVRVAQSAKWWATDGAGKLGMLVIKLPWLALREVKPISIGFGRVVMAWARWCAVAEFAERAALEPGELAKRAKDIEATKSGRRKLSLGVAVVLIGATWWASVFYVEYVIVAGIVLVGVFDAIGRKGQEKKAALPPPMRTVLKEGVPLSQLTAAVVESLLREGREVGIAKPMRYDASRKQYHVQISCLDEITAEHLRAIERGIGADDDSIHQRTTGVSTVRELVILDGDPLAHVPEPPWIESRSRSIAEPQDLGESRGDSPMAVTFAGVHVAVIGKTGSGKTKGLLWAMIDRLSACRDVVLYGIDLAAGPALPMWRGVFQRTAYTPEDAELVLDAALSEIDRRMAVLKAIAEDDDPDNDTDEWLSALGPALVVVIDEFALVAEHNGEKGRLNLMGRVEKILRLGRKVWVTLILATQKAGTSDLGSTVAATQIGVKILLACSERDTVMMYGTEARDRGWSPHVLKPATDDEVRDAGKCYIDGPSHRTPDIYRSYAPMEPREVKRRARQRIADGLPSLGRRSATDEVLDVEEIPQLLVDVEQAFADAGNPDRLPTADLLTWLDDAGYELDERKLAEQLRPFELRPNARWRPSPGANSIRGYYVADVQTALRRFG